MVNIKNNVFSLLLLVATSSIYGQDSITPRTCSRPLPPEHAFVTSLDAPRRCDGNPHCNQGYGVDRYQEYDKLYFTCKMGFELVSSLPYNVMSVTCGRNGQWFPKIEQLGKCVSVFSVKECNSSTLFRCKTSGKCIPHHKKCDCDVDCDDGSDEKDCSLRRKLIMAPPNGKKSSGIISSPGYPRSQDYPNQFNCIYHIYTLPGNHIQLDFEEFDLPKKRKRKCIDSVKLMSVHPEFLKKCRKSNKKKQVDQETVTLPRTSHTKCGKNGFKRVYSNSSHITINVTLGYATHNPSNIKYRGLSLSWQVKNKRDFYQALHQSTEDNKRNCALSSLNSDKESEEDDRMLTVILPIALCGMLPLSILVFCLGRRITMHIAVEKSQSCPSNKIEPPNNKLTTTFTLTENNLAKFDESQFQTTVSTTNKALKSNTCGSSQNSDLPRYIMSYDIPINQPNNNRQSSHLSSQRSTSQSRGRSYSPFSSNHHNIRNSHVTNQNLTNHDISRSNLKHYSTEKMNNSCEDNIPTREGGIQSTCSSQSTCSLCHQRRRGCHSERRINNHIHQHSNQQLNDYYQRPQSRKSDELTYLELYAQNWPQYAYNRHHYMETTYPEHTDEILESKNLMKERYERPSHLYNHSPSSFYVAPPYMYDSDSKTQLSYEEQMPLTLNENDYVDTNMIPTRMHSRVEKRKVIYLEEERRYLSGSEDVYEPYNLRGDGTRNTFGGVLVRTH